MERGLLGVNLLLDDISRSRLKVNVTELLMQDLNIIANLNELKESHLERSRVVIVLEDFVRKPNNFSALKLYKGIFDLEYIYLSTDDVLLKAMSEIAKCYRMDSTQLDYNRIVSVVYEDTVLQERYLTSVNYVSDSVRFAHKASDNSMYPEEVRNLSKNYLALMDILGDKEAQIKAAQEKLEEALLSSANSEQYATAIERMYLDLIKSSKELNRSLKQYSSILSKDVYDKIILSKYVNRPHIIYLKEYEELIHLNSLVDTLFGVFRHQAKQSVKVLRLYDSTGSKRALTVPTHYVRLQNTFTRSDVISNDFIVKTGNYKEIFDLILTNHNDLGVLIVVDCKDHGDTILSGTYLHLAMCRNIKHLNNFGLDKESTIVNNDKDNPMSWDHYSEYSEMKDNDLFLFLSSRKVVQNIYELSKEFSQLG